MRVLAATKSFMEKLFIENEENECSIDLFQFVRDDTFGVTLLCDFASSIEYKKAMEENPLWEILLDKSDKIKYNTDLESKVFDDDFYNNLGEQNLFLLSLDEFSCKELSARRGYIYISSSNIELGWKPVRSVRNDSTLKVTLDKSFPDRLKFNSWQKLEEKCLPLTSMIIFDRYIVGDKKNQRLTDNLFRILSMFCRNTLVKPLKVTIISEFNSDEHIKAAYDKISEFLKASDIGNVEINIIRHDKNAYPNDFEGLHSRQILTNNLRIKCEDSFNLFKENGKVNNGSDISFGYSMSFNSSVFFEKEIKDLKRYVGNLRNKSLETNVIPRVYFYTDKENYLFA